MPLVGFVPLDIVQLVQTLDLPSYHYVLLLDPFGMIAAVVAVTVCTAFVVYTAFVGLANVVVIVGIVVLTVALVMDIVELDIVELDIVAVFAVAAAPVFLVFELVVVVY